MLNSLLEGSHMSQENTPLVFSVPRTVPEGKRCPLNSLFQTYRNYGGNGLLSECSHCLVDTKGSWVVKQDLYGREMWLGQGWEQRVCEFQRQWPWCAENDESSLPLVPDLWWLWPCSKTLSVSAPKSDRILHVNTEVSFRAWKSHKREAIEQRVNVISRSTH